MTEFFNFNPPPNSAFQFEPTLDNQTYSATVSWNLFGQRWYFTLSTTDGFLILARALVGSPDGYNIQSLSWSHGTVKAKTSVPHVYKIMSTVELTVTNCLPIGFNGLQQCFITGTDTFEYTLASDPGPVLQFGQVNYDIDLVKNYFAVSSLVFREQSQQFEVRP